MVEQPSGEQAPDPSTVAVGVRLAEPPHKLGQWLGDASALDAAGAQVLWVDLEPACDLDMLALAAALAAVTYRCRLVVGWPYGEPPPHRAAHTVHRVSRGRLALLADTGRYDEVASGVSGVPVFRRRTGGSAVFDVPGEGGGAERWESTDVPENRAAWREARTRAAAEGVAGLIVPADPRVLDLLRNPDEPAARTDLHLAQG